MNIYRRYFRVTEGPLIDAVSAAVAVNKKAHIAYGEILKEIEEWNESIEARKEAAA